MKVYHTYQRFRLILLITITMIIPFALLQCTESTNDQQEATPFTEPDVEGLRNESLKPFYHSVASGDPLNDRVIIWTRVTPEYKEPVNVSWEVATDMEFRNIISSGDTTTDLTTDYTVKVDVAGLEANTTYYYRFMALDAVSPTGRTRTAPIGNEPVNLAFASCSNYEWGYFNAYRVMAEDDLHAVVHLGDYIYEYASGGYGDTTIGRHVVPNKEITTITDYRTRYSQYRMDPDLQAVHQSHPFITVWDDHEITNNAYVEGAQNHQEGEGDWDNRKAIARKAYYEWMPIRENDGKMSRSFQFGETARLFMLDTRLEGRTEQVGSMHDSAWTAEDRSILGPEQYEWLVNNMSSTADNAWNIIGNQVPFGTLNTEGGESPDKYMDGWDGYPAERERLLNDIRDLDIGNLVIMTGDYHSSFAMENDLNGTRSADDNLAVEFVVPSINSANYDEYMSVDSAQAAGRAYLRNNPHMKHADMIRHGYVRLSLSSDEAKAAFVYCASPKASNPSVDTVVTYRVKQGSPVLFQ